MTAEVVLPSESLSESFVRARGPGGQHVNTTESAVQLRFIPALCPDLSGAARHRLKRLAGHRWTAAGEVVIVAEEFRSQERNRAEARARLVELVRRALAPPPPPRRPTKPSRAARQRRVTAKKQRGQIKAARRAPGRDD
ncbi:ribosome-associated protein [Roseospirillum parvum]|uniref:Ribosome-associated protein n=1 Tax=Roseospirillum parvum TaxID=83401 RepID=A0A1G7TR39_9PROT|nr:ribosome-associated protein [Roseospirillum parvum]